ncbi:EGF-like repeat and discoidin I-like domain-containing protein 3 [Nematostella vectensis]|uniref:EGF-like repeat and discoidin I-like domain-containing protein 3 n=1 Tax=Nematostella vectensis TaxID=45351 RepID=UPI00207711B8|nr:EGF-like repeat and discoidin I-like domain-containing protein 3 [Nematostella vectensis]
MTLPILILLLGLVARMCHTQDPCRNMHFPSPLEDHALFNHTLQNITDISVWNCQVKCYVNQACRAVNYKKGANLGSCELLSAKAGSFPIDLLKFPGIDYYGPNEVCVPNPCPSSNMTCVGLKGAPRYRCECPQGYTGIACETDIDECSSGSNNCHRDRATCANTIGSFACTCKPGYTGDGINCADCAMGMESGAISDSAITASSYLETLRPSHGRLNHASVWASASQSPEEYLQIDLGRATTVTKVATQGNPIRYEWTKSYKISYSTDLSTWKLYREGGQEKVFPGNTDRDTVVYRVLAQPIVTRGIRIIVVTFQHRPALRVEVYECM